MPRLIVTKGVDEGKQFDLSAPAVSVGRHSSSTIALHDTQVSRKHFELRLLSTGGYEIVDLGSGNGTLVNGLPIRAAPLRPGDSIVIGQTHLIYSAGRNDGGPSGLTERVRLLATPDDLASAIVRTVPPDAGSRILSQPDRAATDWLRTKLASLAALYEAADAVSHILELEPLLDKVMDLVFRSVGADHACFMIRSDEGGLVPWAVRYREGLSRHEEIGVSRTIVDHVLLEGHGILVSDAQADDRFRGGDSVRRNGMREVICVPMQGRREVAGVMFLDTQSSLPQLVTRGRDGGKFTEDHLNFASAIAHQAAVAVEENRYHKALVNAERLAAVGQTIAALSHHIKNIMQGARFGADMVRTAIAEEDRDLLKKGWKLVERNQNRIDHLILDMLSFSKEREPLAEPTDLNRLCEDVLELVSGRAQERGIALEWRPGTGVGSVPCDAEGLHRAVLNIVGNAVDAVGGRDAARVAVQVLLEIGGDWACVAVADNGPGIPADQIEDVFKPFVSTKGSARHWPRTAGESQNPPRARGRHHRRERSGAGEQVRAPRPHEERVRLGWGG